MTRPRGDQVEVVNMPFARMDVGPVEPAPQPLLGLDPAYWFKIIEAAILSLTALLIGLFVVRPLIRNMFAAPVPSAGAQRRSAHSTQPASSPRPQARRRTDRPSSPRARPRRRCPARTAAAMIDIQRIDGQVRESSIKKVGEVVDSHPEEALAILRTWLHQPV